MHLGFLAPNGVDRIAHRALDCAETKSASRRLPGGRPSKASKIVASMSSSIAGAFARALRQAGDHHVRIAGHFALGGQRDRDRDDAGEGKPAALADTFLIRRQ